MKDYYLVLGIRRDAGVHEIKDAYRRSAKRCHPDVAGEVNNAEQFKEITEAYETLTDSERRRSYDRQLQGNGSEIPIHPYQGKETGRPGHQTEPAREASAYRHPRTDSRRHWARGDNRNESVLTYTIRLSPLEAREGGAHPCQIWFRQACRRCRRVDFGFFFCPDCGGKGFITAEKELIINVPPGIEDGRRTLLSLDHVGLPGISLDVTVRVRSRFRSADSFFRSGVE